MAKLFKQKKVDEDAIVSSIAKTVKDAVGVSNEKIGTKQALALKLYMREPFDYDIDKKTGKEKIDGKSKWMSSDVQERTKWYTAQTIRVFDNQRQVVSFCPNEPNDQPVADQMTDVCNFVVRSKNSHVAMLSPWAMNGFLTGLGITMVEFRKEREELKPELLQGLTDQQLVELVAQEEAGKIIIEERGEPYDASAAPPAPDLPPELAAIASQMQPKVRDIKIRRIRDVPQMNIKNLPPEDFIVSADAEIDQQTGGIKARLQGHKREITREELIEMGFDAKKVEAIPLANASTDQMAQQRSSIVNFADDFSEDADKVVIYEVYSKIAIADSKRRHYRIVLAGDLENNPVMLHYEEVSKYYPYAPFVPFPIPNTLFGLGMVDMVGPAQKIITQITRLQHDNLSKAVNPLMFYNPDVIRPDDMLALHPGKAIRAEGDPTQGISFIQHPFTAMQAQPIIDGLKQELDYVTGVGGSLASVNASDLQNTTATANAQRASSQQMLVEQVCREFADTGYRYLFRIIIDLFVSYPEEAEQYIRRLTGNYAAIRIDEWDADMDLTANVAFGVTDKIGNAANLGSIFDLQQKLQPMGLASPQTIYHTATRMAENAGEKNAAAFFIDPSTLPPPSNEPPPPNPLVEAEQIKAAAVSGENEKDRQLKIALAELEDRRARERDEQEFRIKALELELKYKAQVDVARIEAEVAAQQQAAKDQGIAFAQAEKERAAAEAQAAQDAQAQQAAPMQAQQPPMPPEGAMTPPQGV